MIERLKWLWHLDDWEAWQRRWARLEAKLAVFNWLMSASYEAGRDRGRRERWPT